MQIYEAELPEVDTILKYYNKINDANTDIEKDLVPLSVNLLSIGSLLISDYSKYKDNEMIGGNFDHIILTLEKFELYFSVILGIATSLSKVIESKMIVSLTNSKKTSDESEDESDGKKSKSTPRVTDTTKKAMAQQKIAALEGLILSLTTLRYSIGATINGVRGKKSKF